jgi:hypothetical protein
MMDWPIDLVEDIARRRAVLFLGAGVSKNAKNAVGERPKDWNQFLELLATKCTPGEAAQIRASIQSSDLLTACELGRRFLRRDVFKQILLHEYSDMGFLAADIHRNIGRLDCRVVITTNFDRLYEASANLVQNNTVLVKNYYDADVADILRRTQRCVLKIHGTIDNADRTIFTRKDYAVARTEHAYFYQVLEALFLTHTFVFLGASMRDPDIQLLLENQRQRFAGTRPHYMVMPEGSTAASVLEIMEESMNLRAVIYDPKDNHIALAEGVAQLVELVEIEREELTRTLNW